jgi:hypothetical protein
LLLALYQGLALQAANLYIQQIDFYAGLSWTQAQSIYRSSNLLIPKNAT